MMAFHGYIKCKYIIYLIYHNLVCSHTDLSVSFVFTISLIEAKDDGFIPLPTEDSESDLTPADGESFGDTVKRGRYFYDDSTSDRHTDESMQEEEDFISHTNTQAHSSGMVDYLHMC